MIIPILISRDKVIVAAYRARNGRDPKSSGPLAKCWADPKVGILEHFPKPPEFLAFRAAISVNDSHPLTAQ